MIKTRVDTSPENFQRLMLANKMGEPDVLSDHLGVAKCTVYRWVSGIQRIPVVVIRYLELKAKKS